VSDNAISGAPWPPSALDRDRWGGLVEPVLQRLERARSEDRLPHAVLLVGPEGLGRELAGLEGAALLSCPESGGPWCACSSCARVRRGVHPDVVVVQGQGHGGQIKIAQTREVVGAVSGRPYEAAARVWILDGVEAGRLGAEAANAFLKTLEEPPAHALFLLLAANPSAVLPTIRSRCHELALPGLVAVAERLTGLGVAPELTSAALSGQEGDEGRSGELVELVGRTRAALESCEPLELISCARRLARDPVAFEVAASAVLAMAAEAGNGDGAEALVRLAAELLRVEGRTRALNLSPERQLLSCLLQYAQGSYGRA